MGKSLLKIYFPKSIGEYINKHPPKKLGGKLSNIVDN